PVWATPAGADGSGDDPGSPLASADAPPRRLRVPRSPSRSCQALHGLVDALAGCFDFLHVEPAPRDQAVLDAEQGHSAHVERRFAGPRSGPSPFGPDRVSVFCRGDKLCAKVGYAGEEGVPVLLDLLSTTEPSTRMRRLLAPIVRREAAEES